MEEKLLERNGYCVGPGMSEASPALGANEAVSLLMPSSESQWPYLLTQDLSWHPWSPQGRMSPVLRYTVAPVLPLAVMSLLTPSSPCCPLAVSVSPEPYIALFPLRSWGLCCLLCCMYLITWVPAPPTGF